MRDFPVKLIVNKFYVLKNVVESFIHQDLHKPIVNVQSLLLWSPCLQLFYIKGYFFRITQCPLVLADKQKETILFQSWLMKLRNSYAQEFVIINTQKLNSDKSGFIKASVAGWNGNVLPLVNNGMDFFLADSDFFFVFAVFFVSPIDCHRGHKQF